MTGDLTTNVGYSASYTWSQIQAQLASQSYAEVMLTPYEFYVSSTQTVNQTMITELRSLLTLAKNSGVQLVLVKELNRGWGVTPTTTGPSC